MKKRLLDLILSSSIGLLFLGGCGPAQENGRHRGVSDQPTDTLATFEELAENYESMDRVIWQKPELIINRMGELEGKTVADIGAGTGYFSFRLAGRGANVLAIDIDPRAVAWMEREEKSYPQHVQDRLNARLAEADDPGLEPGEADIVLLVNTYGYIENRIDYFRRLKRGMIPGGELLIVDFKRKETVIGPPLEERLSAEEVVSELIAAGYDIVELDKESLDYQYIITATPHYNF